MAAMLKIYGIKNCTSMKKAFDLLTEQGLSYEFHDYKNRASMLKPSKPGWMPWVRTWS